jgi:hypothetical protein
MLRSHHLLIALHFVLLAESSPKTARRRFASRAAAEGLATSVRWRRFGQTRRK